MARARADHGGGERIIISMRAYYATLLEITFENVNILSIEGAFMQDSSVDGRNKAAVIKQLLNINPNEVLMETVRKRINVSLIPETEDEWELTCHSS